MAIDEEVCSFLSSETVEVVLGQWVTLAEEHLSAITEAWVLDCVSLTLAG